MISFGVQPSRLLFVVLVASVLSACSLVVEPDVDSLGSPPRTCKPRDEAVCACLGGVQGVQVCNEGGSFEPCICGGAGFGG